MTSPIVAEPIIDPELPIVDAHHHFWLLPEAYLTQKRRSNDPMWPVLSQKPRYLFDEFMVDLNTGHNICATVYVEAHAMYRAGGSEAMKSVGEVEFVNGVAAMAACGVFGDIKVAAGIVGNADLCLGDKVEEVLDAHLLAGGGRYRGVRNITVSDPDKEGAFGGFAEIPAGILRDAKFRAGFRKLHKLGLSYDAVVLEPQLPDVIDLARAFPETPVILNHVGLPVGVSSYAGQREERFRIWRDNVRSLAKCANVTVKLGGLGQSFGGFSSFLACPPATSAQIAADWRPYIETSIEAFGADRCMFESNYPVDAGTCSYPVLWNVFKHLAAGASREEKTALFSGTAKRIYRLDI